MISLEAATHPLDFAYVATKRMYWGNEQTTCLQEIATLFGDPSAPVDTSKSLALLSESRRIMQQDADGLSCHYPFLVTDYEKIGRHDLALEVIDDSTAYALGESALDRTILMINTATACLDIGETDRCLKIIPGMNHLLRFAQELEWYSGAFPLLLRLGRVRDAVLVAKYMDARSKASAFAEIAFHESIAKEHAEKILAYALDLLERSHYVTEDVDIFDWSRVHIAMLHAYKGQFEKALELVRKLKDQSYSPNVLSTIASRMLKSGMINDAVRVLTAIQMYHKKRQDIVCLEHVRSPLSRDFQLRWIPDEKLLPLVPQLCQAGLDDIAGSFLTDALANVERILDYTTRLENLAKLVRWFVPVDRDVAETLVERVLAAPLADLEPKEDNPTIKFSRTAPAILFRLAIDIFKHDLSWNEKRQEQFGKHLEPLPVYGKIADRVACRVHQDSVIF